MLVLIDTNIVLDFVLVRNPFFNEVNELFIRLQNNEFDAFVSPITPINVFYTTRKEKDKSTAFFAVENLIKVVKITKSNNQIFEDAIKSNFKDFEDAVQHESAISENIDAIITRNTKDFVNSTIKVYSPKEFLEVLK